MTGGPRIVLRFLFDAGSETCLWAASDVARERFGDSWVDIEALPVPRDLIDRLAGLVARYDASIDWDDPAGPSRWTQEQRDAFARDVQDVLPLLHSQLGPEFHVIDESGTAPARS